MNTNKSPQETILIVDDEPQNLKLLQKVLKEDGYKLRSAPSGEMGLAIVKKYPPDIILLDINMPGMDGYQVCRSLKENELTSYIPIIFLTAYDELPEKLKGFETGAIDYITKPFQAEELLARVKSHLKLHKEKLKRKKSGLYEKSTLTENQKSEIISSIKEYMEETNIFLKSTFTIEILSKDLGANLIR